MSQPITLQSQIQTAMKAIVGRFLALTLALVSLLLILAVLHTKTSDLEDSANLISSTVSVDLEAALNRMIIISSLPETVASLQGGQPKSGFLGRFVRNANDIQPHSIEFFDRAGKPLILAEVSTDRDDVAALLKQSIEHEALRYRISKDRYDPILIISRPVLADIENRPIGYLLMHFNLMHVLNHIALPSDLAVEFLSRASDTTKSKVSGVLNLSTEVSLRASNQGQAVPVHLKITERAWDDYLLVIGVVTLLAAALVFVMERINRWVSDFTQRITQRLSDLVSTAEQLISAKEIPDIKPDPTQDEIGSVNRSLVGLLRKEREYEHQLYDASYKDPLSGLPNYRSFKEKLQAYIQQDQGKNGFYVGFIDLNNLKAINEAYGFEVGDQAIMKSGRHLAAKLPPGSFLCRRSADEFSVLMDVRQSREDIDRLLGPLLTSSRVSIGLSSKVIATLQFTIGIAQFPKDADNERDILIAAGAALQEGKKTHRPKLVWFDEHIKASVVRRYQIQQKVRTLLNGHGFVLYYQPKVDMRSHQVIGFESLVRMPDAEEGFISPEEFIPIAEDANYIEELTAQLLARLLHDKERIRARFPEAKISFNVSPKLFNENRFAKLFADGLDSSPDGYSGVVIEITETEVAQNLQITLNQLNTLIGLGAEISIDDFGKGYSSLSRLSDLPVHELKIDASFVRSFELTGNDRMIRGIVGIARSLGLEIVAEGVETETQAKMLIEAGCFKAQGWHYAKALPLDAVLRLPQQLEVSDTAS